MQIEQISGIVLEGMKKLVEDHFGTRLENIEAVVTVPAYFNAA